MIILMDQHRHMLKETEKTVFAYKFKKMLYERKKAEVEKSISF